MANFYVGEVLFETGGTIDTPGDINVTAILDCAGTTGTAGQILSSTGTALLWTTASAAGIPCSILTAKGDIVVATGASTPTALPVGTNGQVLYANSACASGLEWGTQPITCLDFDAKGDLLAGAGSDSFATLGAGTDGQILYACSTAATGLCWAAAPSGASPATPTVAGVLEGYSCGVDENISVGFGSMPLVDPASGGCRNTSLGVCALSNLTFGSGNVAIGSQTLFCATNSGNSIAIGNCALRSSTFSGNVAIGNRAACTVTTGDNNVAIGNGAMQNATTPSLSIAIGCRAMQCGAGCGNIGFGLQALCRVSGDSNIAIGFASGSNVTTGINNTFLGGATGGFVSTGSCNIFIGFGAGPTTNSSCCLWIGVDSTPPWLTGNNTSAIKPGAGIIDCAGSCGTAGQVLMSNGSNAICWGAAGGSGTVTSITAGTGLTGGTITTSGTVALDTSCVIQPSILTAKGGLISASAASTPSQLAVGTNGQVLTACSACTTGLVWTTPAGASAATPSVSGTVFGCANATNAVIGSGALAALTTGTCNAGLGVAAFPALTSGCYNIALGDSGGSTITSGCYNVAIGSGQSVSSPTGNCQLAIGPQLGFSWLTGDSTLAIKPGAGIIDCAGSCGTAGQVLTSSGSNALQWATPQTYPYVTYETAATATTTGVPITVFKWAGGSFMEGSVTAPTSFNSATQIWEFYLSGDPTNLTTGWLSPFQWPASGGMGDQGAWSVDFPVYPDPDQNLWVVKFTPAVDYGIGQNFKFTFTYKLNGSPIAWQL